ncbi:MAG: XRE family transcriptional regulator [Bacteroidota bacterium]
MTKITMILEKTNTGFSAYAIKYPVFTAGKNLDELKKGMLESLNLYFSEQGRVVRENDLLIRLDIPQFFSFYRVINAKALSERIGMNQSLLAQYIKGIKTPSTAQSRRIVNGIHKLGQELVELKIN